MKIGPWIIHRLRQLPSERIFRVNFQLSPVLMYDPRHRFIAATVLQLIWGYLSENSAIIIVNSWGRRWAPSGNISPPHSTGGYARGAWLLHLAVEGNVNLAFSTEEIQNLATSQIHIIYRIYDSTLQEIWFFLNETQ